MKRNWYVICTQPRQEKKVAALLTKKGIENFCPFSITEVKNVSRSTLQYGPLFKSYVFVNVEESEIHNIRKLPYVVNPLYWKSKPAVINTDEIDAIKMMVGNYSIIKPEKYAVKVNDHVGVMEKSITAFSNHVTAIKHQGIKVTLPSLGYTLVSERDKAKAATIVEKKEPVGVALVKKLNPLFLFGF